MKKINFITIEEGIKIPETTNKEDILLFYFVSDFDEYMLDTYLPLIKSVASGEKEFNEIENDYWTFGEGAGYFECDTNKAYLNPWKEDIATDAPSIEMPVNELIQILEDWKKYLKK